MLRHKKVLVYTVYLDDSGRDRTIQLVGAVMIPAEKNWLIEQQSGHIIQSILAKYPNVLAHPRFEFHATEMWNRTKEPWSMVDESDKNEIFRLAVDSLKYIDHPCVTYGCIDISGYPKTKEGKHAAVNAAFENCCHSISSWFDKAARAGRYGNMIFDECDGDLKSQLRRTFRELRLKVVSSPQIPSVLECIGGDLYFGDSKYSVGLQVADICSWLLIRHLSGSAREDSEFYSVVSPFVFPSDSSDAAPVPS